MLLSFWPIYRVYLALFGFKSQRSSRIRGAPEAYSVSMSLLRGSQGRLGCRIN
jgi:hypothetical protein